MDEIYKQKTNPYKEKYTEKTEENKQLAQDQKQMQLQLEELQQKYENIMAYITSIQHDKEPEAITISNVLSHPKQMINNVDIDNEHSPILLRKNNEKKQENNHGSTIKTQADLDMALRGSIMYFPFLDTAAPKVWVADMKVYIKTYLTNCTEEVAKNHIIQQLKFQQKNNPTLTNALASDNFKTEDSPTPSHLTNKIGEFFERPGNAVTGQRQFQAITMPTHYMEAMKYQEFLAMLNVQANQLLAGETDQTKARMVYTTFMEKVGPPRLQYELELRSNQANIDPKSPAKVWAKQATLMAKEATNIAFTLNRHAVLWQTSATRPELQTNNKQITQKQFINNTSANQTSEQPCRVHNGSHPESACRYLKNQRNTHIT